MRNSNVVREGFAYDIETSLQQSLINLTEIFLECHSSAENKPI